MPPNRTQPSAAEIVAAESKGHSLSLFHASEIESLEIVEKRGKPYLTCYATGKQRPAKPEEIVRQLYLRKLMQDYGYATDRIDVEKGVYFGSSMHRIGDRHLFPGTYFQVCAVLRVIEGCQTAMDSHSPVPADLSTASQTYWVSRASRKLGRAGSPLSRPVRKSASAFMNVCSYPMTQPGTHHLSMYGWSESVTRTVRHPCTWESSRWSKYCS